MNLTKSEELFQRAKLSIPGGVNSPVRAFKSVGGTPVFIERASGSKIYDADGNEYIDYVGSWGPHLFGHLPGFIVTSIIEALENGTSYGAPTELEIRMAELVKQLVHSVELVRMVSSGTEACMSAIRLARGYTGREKIIKFEGCYHGHADSFLIKAGSGALTFGQPTSPGVTRGAAADTLNADYNDIDSVQKLIAANQNEIAAVIIEPIAGNMGVVASEHSFLSQLREICTNNNIVLIFDEVISGFRVGGKYSKGCTAQDYYGIYPDLTTFGKIIGGGLPVGAFGGRRDIMEKISPLGAVYQAGTLSGNPLAISAGIAVLEYIIKHPDIYVELEKKAAWLENEMRLALLETKLTYTLNRIGSMMTLFFTTSPVNNYASAIKSNTALYAKYFHEMLNRGVYLAPSQFEAAFVSLSHSNEDLLTTADAFRETVLEL